MFEIFLRAITLLRDQRKHFCKEKPFDKSWLRKVTFSLSLWDEMTFFGRNKKSRLRVRECVPLRKS